MGGQSSHDAYGHKAAALQIIDYSATGISHSRPSFFQEPRINTSQLQFLNTDIHAGSYLSSNTRLTRFRHYSCA